jgi:hypothetical protein
MSKVARRSTRWPANQGGEAPRAGGKSPLSFATAFCELMIKRDNPVCSPVSFVFERVVSCLTDEELERVYEGVW